MGLDSDKYAYQRAEILVAIIKAHLKNGDKVDAEKVFDEMDSGLTTTFQEARLAILEANYSEANLQTYLKESEGYVDFTKWISLTGASGLLAKHGQIDRALSLAETIEDDSHQSNCLVKNIEILLENFGNSERAEEVLHYIKVDEYEWEALYLLAQYYAKHNQLERGYGCAQQISSGIEKFFTLLGLCEQQGTDRFIDEAVTILDSLDSYIWEVYGYANLIRVLVKIGDLERAELNIGRKQKKEYAVECYMLLAQALHKKNNAGYDEGNAENAR